MLCPHSSRASRARSQGYALWQRIGQSQPALVGKVRGAVFDCGPALDDYFGEEQWFQTIWTSVVSTMVTVGATPPGQGSLDAARTRLAAASRLLATQKSFSYKTTIADKAATTRAGQNAERLTPEDGVPTLCLTSPQDAVIAQSAVESFSAALLEEAEDGAAPRDVRVVVLRGEHCKLGVSDRDAYREALGAFIGRVRTAAAAQQAARAREENWLSFLERHGLEELLEEMAFGDAAALEEGDYPLVDAFALLASGGRTALLQKLKVLGVATLPWRQKLVNAFQKDARERRELEVLGSNSKSK